MGNLHSAAKAFEHVAPDAHVSITSSIEEIDNADRVVLPGVGAMGDCMAEIRRLGFDTLVHKAVQEKPLLAICVGMQALMSHSEENSGVEGIGLIPGQVRFFGNDLMDDQNMRLKVPHMGWNQVHQNGAHKMWNGINQDARFYFVHSYFIDAEKDEDISGITNYGQDFASAMSVKNVFSVQFHPEKSHSAGLQLLSNFVNWDGVKG